MEAFSAFISWLNSIVWGPPMLILLVGTHLFLTFRLGFIQKSMFKAIKLSVTKDPGASGDISQFGALTTALAATIGTGNIVGVATAVALGGPGAVFWCWITGLFGIATKYSEGLVAVKYRVKTSDGTMLGGPMYALENGLKMKWLGVLFALFASVAAFGIGSSVQANAIVNMLETQFNFSPLIVGIVLTIVTFVVVVGGVKSIASVCEKLVPFMAIFYVTGCFIILCLNGSYVIPAITTILKFAFTGEALVGGAVGGSILNAIRFGVARGLFSNEAGLGSAPIAAAAAQTRNPVRQALVSMTGVFWDTIVVCLMSGLVLVSSQLKNPAIYEGLSGGDLTNMAFSQMGYIGTFILAVGLVTFAFSTILGWSYYGERCAEYLLGKKIILPYKIIYCLTVFAGSVVSLTLVWDIADALNALMAIPNLISLLLLSGVIVSETKKYLWDNNIDGESEDVVIQI